MNLNISIKFLIALLITLHSLGATSQSINTTTIDVATRKQILLTLEKSLRDDYVFPEVGERAASFVESMAAKGAYDSYTENGPLAEALTRDLQAVSHDKHLSVFPADPKDGPDETTRRIAREKRGVHDNFGFAKVDRLPGNVGYLDLRLFYPPDIAGPTAIAAMNVLSHTEAIIVDLRRNGGGDPTMIQLLCSYFFAERTHLNDLYWRKGGRTEQYWTLAYVPGNRMPSIPLFVLTSSGTFSGAEEFANDMKMLKRARIIGETTGGGANPGESYPLVHGLRVFIPEGRAVNPISGTNWEGTGVEPDQKVDEREAFDVAYAEALEKIKSSAAETSSKAEIDWALEGIQLRRTAVVLTDEELRRYVGDYGPWHITCEGNRLVFTDEWLSKVTLLPSADDNFQFENVEYMRIGFLKDNGGRYGKAIIRYDSGGREEQNRK